MKFTVRFIGLLLYTVLFGSVFMLVGVLAVSRLTAAPRGVGRPLAMAETPDVEKVAKRVERKVDTSNETLSKQITVLSQRTDLALSQLDLLKKEFEAFKKDTDARLMKATPQLSAGEDLPEIIGFTPSWFACPWCEVAKKESEDPNLPFRVLWSEVTEKQLKELGIPADAKFPCFYWTDSKGKGWYAYSFGEGNPKETRMQGLERKWKEHR